MLNAKTTVFVAKFLKMSKREKQKKKGVLVNVRREKKNLERKSRIN